MGLSSILNRTTNQGGREMYKNVMEMRITVIKEICLDCPQYQTCRDDSCEPFAERFKEIAEQDAAVS